MSTSPATSALSPNRTFWTLVGVGVLAVLLAASWRVATGAELEAKGREWSLKVTEAVDSLDAARRQIEAEAKRIKEESAKREEYLTQQIAAAKASCPRAAEAAAPPPPPALQVPEKRLAEVARTTEQARNVARDISKFRVPKF